jgi:hypothetical protein
MHDPQYRLAVAWQNGAYTVHAAGDGALPGTVLVEIYDLGG